MCHLARNSSNEEAALEACVTAATTAPSASEAVAGKTTENHAVDSNQATLVDWDGPDDPANPINWSSARKWVIITLVSATAFNTSMASTILAPGLSSVLMEFHVSVESSTVLGPLLVSIYIVGLALGPLFLAPLCEHFGRSAPLHIANVTFTLSALLATLAVSYPMLIVFRLLMGIACCIPATVGSGYIADLIAPERRGRALGLWIIGPIMGPVVAPLLGGYLALDTSWRWTQGLTTIIGAVTTVASGFFIHETYAPYLMRRKIAVLQCTSPTASFRHQYDIDAPTGATAFRHALARPAKILLRSRMVLLLSILVSVVYSYTYLLITTFTAVFQDTYSFNLGEAGLAYLGLGSGLVLGQLSLGPWSDFYLRQKRQTAGDAIKPEDRLPPAVLGTILVSIGLLWYGWSVNFHLQWMIPIIGTAFCGLGISFILLSVQAYLVDAFPLYAASAVGANIVVRSIFGACLPLAGPALYARLGLGWGNTLLSFLCLLFGPIALIAWRKGERLRRGSEPLHL